MHQLCREWTQGLNHEKFRHHLIHWPEQSAKYDMDLVWPWCIVNASNTYIHRRTLSHMTYFTWAVNPILSYTAYIISDQWLELACSIELEIRWKSWYLFVGVAYGERLKYVITDRFFLLRPVREETADSQYTAHLVLRWDISSFLPVLFPLQLLLGHRQQRTGKEATFREPLVLRLKPLVVLYKSNRDSRSDTGVVGLPLVAIIAMT